MCHEVQKYSSVIFIYFSEFSPSSSSFDGSPCCSAATIDVFIYYQHHRREFLFLFITMYIFYHHLVAFGKIVEEPKNLESINFPEGLEEIGEEAFYKCSKIS